MEAGLTRRDSLRQTNHTTQVMGSAGMNVIHFTQGATDPLMRCRGQGARFVRLADGVGESHVSCMHLESGGGISDLRFPCGAALLIVHGRGILIGLDISVRLDLLAGMGVVLAANEGISLSSETGAIVIVFESTELEAHECGLSTPGRMMGQCWPGEAPSGVAGLR